MDKATIEEENIWLKNESYTNDERKLLVEATALKIDGSIKYKDIEKTIFFFLKKTPIARATFKFIDNKVMKIINNNLDFSKNNFVSFYDFRDISTNDRKHQLNRIINKPINLNKEVIKFSLCRYEESSYILLLCAHHIAVDHISTIKCLSEIISTYQDIVTNNVQSVPFTNYTKEYTQFISSRDEKILENSQAKEYWKEKFKLDKEFTSVLQDNPYPQNGFVNSELIVEEILSPRDVKKYAKVNRVTPFIVLLSILNLLLTKRSRDKVHCATSIIFSTRERETQNILGCFINSLPIITQINLDDKFKDILEKVRSELKSISRYKQYPFSKVNKFFQSVRELPYHPLQRILATYTIYKPFKVKVENVNFEYLPIRSPGTNGADMSIVFVDNSKNINMEINYNQDIFNKNTIIDFVYQFNTLLEGVIEDVDFKKSLKEYSLLTKEEEEKLLITYNQTKSSCSKDKTIHQLFEEQVDFNPNNIAVIYKNEKLTYKQLNEKSNQLAHYLIKQSIKPDDLVAICVDRSIDMIIGILGILKAGGAYVPIDPSSPYDRVKTILKDSKSKVFLIQENLERKLPKSVSKTIVLETLNIDKEEKSNPCTNVLASNLAYVIYTSGSTGTPKGVMIEHKNVQRLFLSTEEVYNFHNKDTWTLFHSFSFDFSVWEINGALLYGGKLIIVPYEISRSPDLFSKLLLNNNVTILNQTPSAFKQLMIFLKKDIKRSALRYIIFGGEKLEFESLFEQYQHLKNNDIKMVNMYGITEITIHSTYKYILDNDLKEKTSNIGCKLAGFSFYILDKYLTPVPKGVVGELYISGDGLARGYLNRPTLTKEKFINNPFETGKRLYKTGDLVKYLEDGNIEYIGRIDNQIKIRGFRIELGEIEQQLLKIEDIKEAIVLAKEDIQGNKFLVAYISTKNNKIFKNNELRNILLNNLPNYMIPSTFKTLKRIPLTINGKIDKKALSALSIEVESSKSYVAPTSEIEKKLIQIFSEVLNINKIGVYDDFFELGGDSLLAVQLVSKINDNTQLNISIKDMFSNSTVTSIIQIGSNFKEKKTQNLITKRVNYGEIPVTYQQERLWFIEQKEKSYKYNIPVAIKIFQNLDVSNMESIFNSIIKRHNILQTTFHYTRNGVIQKVNSVAKQKVKFFDLTKRKDKESVALNICKKESLRDFDLLNGMLIYLTLVKLDELEYVFILNFHHIVGDEVSIKILLNEFELCLVNKVNDINQVVKPLDIQYHDYAIWQRGLPIEKEKLDYWKKELLPFPKKIDFLKLKNRDKSSTKSYKRFTKKISLDNLKKIKDENQFTIAQISLALYVVLINKYTQANSIIVSIPINSREDQLLNNIVGFFINTLLLKFDIDYADNIISVIEQTKEKLLGVMNNNIPLNQVIGLLRKQGLSIDEDSVQCSFNSTVAGKTHKNSKLKYSEYDFGHVSKQSPLLLSIDETDNELTIRLEYSQDIFDFNEIEKFFLNYCDTLENLDIEQPIRMLPFFDNEIKEKYNFTDNTKVYPLSNMQKDIYLKGAKYFDNKYIIGAYLMLDDKYEVDKLKDTIHNIFNLTKFHQIRFVEYNRSYYQVETNLLSNTIITATINKDENIQEKIFTIAKENISLSSGSLFKCIILYDEENKLQLLSLVSHHLILDGNSLAKLTQLIEDSYTRQKEYKVTSMFDNFIEHFKEKRDNVFWRKQLTNISVIEPLESPKELTKKYLTINKNDLLTLKRIQREHRVSQFSLLLSLYVSVLYKIQNFQDDVVFFEPIIVGNSLRKIHLGLNITIMPLIIKKSYFEEEINIIILAEKIDRFRKMKKTTLSNDDYQLIKSNRVNLINYMPRLTISDDIYPMDSVAENETHFSVYPSHKNIDLHFYYQKGFFSSIDIKEKFNLYLKCFLKDPKFDFLKTPLLNSKEKDEILVQYNSTKADYLKDKTIHKLFEEQVQMNPNTIAVVYKDEMLTYEQLNTKSNKLAHYLIKKGITPDSLVSICLDRSLDMIIGILAILKAGGAYVPIDPTYPKDRIRYMLDDSKSEILITQEHLKELIPKTQEKRIFINSLNISEEKTTNPNVNITSNNLAYLIYTSGSTGVPKGVMVEHRGVINLLTTERELFKIKKESVMCQFFSYSFDFSITEIFIALCSGIKLAIPTLEERLPPQLELYTEKMNITHLFLPPSVLSRVDDNLKLKSLEVINVGGEVCPLALADRWREKVNFFNTYGPTEATIDALYFFYDITYKAKKSLPIGSPIQNTKVYILDKFLNPIPKGLVGELHISGDNLARGYLNQPKLTNEKFINNPFEKGTRLYKTGDLVKYLEDGNIEYIGRIDEQVKIRGFRIELGEIEQQLLKIEDIKEAIVLAKEDNHAHKSLIAYIVTRNDKLLDNRSLKTALSKYLPSYMIPVTFKMVDNLPLTPNGKVDKKKLATLEIDIESSIEFVAPRDKIEEVLAEIFSEVLNIEKIGIHDDFFELGGDSLKSIEVVTLAKKNNLQIEVKDIFLCRTVLTLAKEAQAPKKVEKQISTKKEVFLEEDIITPQKNYSGNDGDILLTGATGFLGSYLLSELLKVREQKVFCLVRCNNEKEGFLRIKKKLISFSLWNELYSQRIIVIKGDLALKKMGIKEEIYFSLSKKVTKIYHVATYMNSLAAYDTLKNVNVGGVKRIIKFASIGAFKKIEYVSTIDIFSKSNNKVVDEISLLKDQVHYPSNGYACSKYIAEGLIEIAKKRGFEIKIYRVGLITGDTIVGKNEKSQWFYDFLNGILESKAITNNINFMIPIVPVDYVAKSILILSEEKTSQNIFHLSTPFLINFIDLIKDIDIDIEILNMYDFSKKIKTYNKVHKQSSFFTSLVEKSLDFRKSEFNKPNQANENIDLYVQSFQTMKTLKNLGVHFPLIDTNLIKLYFKVIEEE